MFSYCTKAFQTETKTKNHKISLYFDTESQNDLFQYFAYDSDNRWYLARIIDLAKIVAILKSKFSKEKIKINGLFFSYLSRIMGYYVSQNEKDFVTFVDEEYPDTCNFSTDPGFFKTTIDEIYDHMVTNTRCVLNIGQIISLSGITDQCMIGLSEYQYNLLTKIIEICNEV